MANLIAYELLPRIFIRSQNEHIVYIFYTRKSDTLFS